MAAPEDSFTFFAMRRTPQSLRLLSRIHEAAVARDLTVVADATLDVIGGLLTDLNDVATRIAEAADLAIMRKMVETHARNRPFAGDMETHVVSLPGQLGLVQVALISELDKIVNPRGYGPYWRAQEYGTGSQEVVSQVDRPIFGIFEPSGTAPDSSQRGLGVGSDAAFLSGASSTDAGKGIISVELPGRHFLRDGAAEVGPKYLAAMKEVDAKWAGKIRALIDDAAVQVMRSRHRYILRA